VLIISFIRATTVKGHVDGQDAALVERATWWVFGRE
jgi:hypothetical protein